ncbi:MAG: ABC transporter permease [Eubacteriales bacterium]|nr:ABC transporter permease [Eubacteriales bacterium]
MTLISFINAAVLAGTPLLLATLGEILTEKSGQLNLGVEGMMYMGAVSGLAAAWYTEKLIAPGWPAAFMALIISFIVGSLGALIYAFLTITLRANQNVTGLTLTIFGTGFAKFFGEVLSHKAGGYVTCADPTKAAFAKLDLPYLSSLPIVGKLFFNYNLLVYFAFIVAIVMAVVFYRTRAGLKLRAVGEDPAAADAAGIRVIRSKYLATIIGGGLCGIGGMYMSMVNQKGIWVPECVSGYGWLAVALVIFATWSPLRAIYCAIIFGGLTILSLYLRIPGLDLQLYGMLPFVVTIFVLIFTSIRQAKEHRMPKSCGVNYFREER